MPSSPKTESSDLAPGSFFGPYRIDSQLGQGGMGTVYLAYDLRLGRTVALKVLSKVLREDQEARTRLAAEARIAARLSHPSICVIYEAGEQDECAFIAMELIEGLSLGRMVRPAGLPAEEAARYGAQIAEALHYAHTHGVVHRDVKCANVIVSENGRAKVLDFGLAQFVLSGDINEWATSRSSLPELGPVAGTFPYVAPEILHGKAATTRSDIWSLGVVLYEMGTGRLPFQGNTAFELSMEIMVGAGPDVSTVPPALRGVVARCLEKDPAKRYETAQDVSTELLAASASSRTARRAFWGKRALAAAGALMVLILLAASIPRVRDRVLRGVSAPREIRSLLLAQFSNRTGDPVFDDTLNEALSVALEQSPALKMLTASQVHRALMYLERPPTATLTPELAQEVCVRAAGSAVVEGSISRMGDSYVIGITAKDCHTGDILAESQRSARTKEKVLEALGSSAAQLRSRLGESAGSIRQYDVPIVQATTSSFAALQSFGLGVRAAEGASGYASAIPFFRRAIALDPQFASAYEGLGVAYADLGELDPARENLRKAYELRNQVSEPERLQIEAHYYDLVTGDLAKARNVYQVWTGIYPENAMAHANLAACHALQGEYQQALDEVQKALTIEPGGATREANLISFYLALDRLPDASAACDQAFKQHPGEPYLHVLRYQLAFLEHDASGRARELVWAKNKAGIEDVLLAYEADTQAYYGHLAAARELSRRAEELAEDSGQKEVAAGWLADAGLREALFGNGSAARSDAVRSLGYHDRDVDAASALALALAHDPQAEKLADELAQRYPEDTSVNRIYLPAIRGAVALSKGHAREAITLLQHATGYEMGSPTTGWLLLAMYPVYVRGLAYLALGRGGEAAGEFDKIRTHPGVVLNEPIGALSLFQSARAHALAGDAAVAHEGFDDFRALWSGADKNILILRQARAWNKLANR